MSRPSLLVSYPHAKPVHGVLAELHVNQQTGLSAEEVRRRRLAFGQNDLPKGKPRSAVALFLERFSDTLVLLLLLAGVVSVVLGHIGDAVIVFVTLFIDASLNFVQSWRTEKTLQRMQKQVQDMVKVIRGGQSKLIPAAEVVVGDIVQLRSGRHIPADARLITSAALSTQESLLTGEMTDVIKSAGPVPERTLVAARHNMVFAGTSVVAGSGLGVVTAIGLQTEFGKIANVMRGQVSPPSPLRRHLRTTSLLIGGAVIIFGTLLTLAGLMLGHPLPTTLRTAITLIVSAIPEDLTMILTVALTVGVLRISRRGGAVRQLSSAETLGATTTICTDKTGTLTLGQMRAKEFNLLQGSRLPFAARPTSHFQELALTGLALANDAYQVGGGGQDEEKYFGSATERAALAFTEGANFVQSSLRQQWKLISSIPFSTQWKYRAVLAHHPTQNVRYAFAIGAPEVLLERSDMALSEHEEAVPLTHTRRAQLLAAIEEAGSSGARLLAVTVNRHMPDNHLTHRNLHGLLFLGLLMIEDPIRPEVRAAISQTQSAGVHVMLVTGDHLSTAKAVGAAVGLSAAPEHAVTGAELHEMTDEELRVRLPQLAIVARVEPLDKQRIVRLLQERGEVVAMTGDGINDAVALKGADIGVAMGSGSDIAKDASDLVLLDNSLATIVAAIQEGRVLRDNVRKVMAYLLSTNMAEVLIFFASLLLGLPLPLLPAQILWINVVTDGTSDIALSLEPAEEDVMRRGPDDPKRLLLGRTLGSHIALSGIIMTVATMLVFWYAYAGSETLLPYARTMAFAFLATSSLLSVWSFRTNTRSVWRSLIGNRWVFASTGVSFSLQLLALYVPAFRSFFGMVPLSGPDWLIILLGSVITVILMDMRKWVFPVRGGRLAPMAVDSLNRKRLAAAQLSNV